MKSKFIVLKYLIPVFLFFTNVQSYGGNYTKEVEEEMKEKTEKLKKEVENYNQLETIRHLAQAFNLERHKTRNYIAKHSEQKGNVQAGADMRVIQEVLRSKGIKSNQFENYMYFIEQKLPNQLSGSNCTENP